MKLPAGCQLTWVRCTTTQLPWPAISLSPVSAGPHAGSLQWDNANLLREEKLSHSVAATALCNASYSRGRIARHAENIVVLLASSSHHGADQHAHQQSWQKAAGSHPHALGDQMISSNALPKVYVFGLSSVFSSVFIPLFLSSVFLPLFLSSVFLLFFLYLKEPVRLTITEKLATRPAQHN